jgi:hypothetical protein
MVLGLPALRGVFASDKGSQSATIAFISREIKKVENRMVDDIIGMIHERELVCGKDPEDCCCFRRLEELSRDVKNYRNKI